MQKRGQIETLIFVVVIVGMLIIGAYGTTQVLSKNRYIGDTSTKIVYDLKYCDVIHIQQKNIISFSSIKEAKGYENAECNK